MLEDWENMYHHARNLEANPEFQAWMTASGWNWSGLWEDANDTQVMR